MYATKDARKTARHGRRRRDITEALKKGTAIVIATIEASVGDTATKFSAMSTKRDTGRCECVVIVTVSDAQSVTRKSQIVLDLAAENDFLTWTEVWPILKSMGVNIPIA